MSVLLLFSSLGSAVAEPGAGDLDLVGLAPTVPTGLTERLTPNTILASTNLRDTLANIPPQRLEDIDEEAGSDDGEWWTAVDPEADIDVRFGFPATSGNLVGTQTLRVLIRGSSLPSRDWRVDLWEAGTEKIPTATGTVTSISGQVATLTFEPSDVTDISGAGVEIRIRATAA